MPTREEHISTVLDHDRLASTGRRLVRLLLFGFGVMLVFVAVRLSFEGGWAGSSFNGPFVPLLPVIALGLALLYGGWMMWTRGRLRRAVCLGAAAVLVFGGGIAVVSRLPEDLFPGFPHWMMALAGVVAIVLGVLLREGPARPLDGVDGNDPDAKATRIRHLLIGRYGFPRAVAASATAALPEAPASNSASSNSASPVADALDGHPEVVAARLAARTPEAAARTILLKRLAWLVAVALWLGLVGVPGILEDGLDGQGALMVALGVLVLAWSLWRLVPARRAGDADTLLRLRSARARRIDLVIDPHA
ncbi:hypothetical protein [Arthrobacter sp.]|uniref:hypothetical protein n=1 Tax=Arthrobacter sp. TaxID=1667 RepID=UPI003A926ED5